MSPPLHISPKVLTQHCCDVIWVLKLQFQRNLGTIPKRVRSPWKYAWQTDSLWHDKLPTMVIKSYLPVPGHAILVTVRDLCDVLQGIYFITYHVSHRPWMTRCSVRFAGCFCFQLTLASFQRNFESNQFYLVWFETICFVFFACNFLGRSLDSCDPKKNWLWLSELLSLSVWRHFLLKEFGKLSSKILECVHLLLPLTEKPSNVHCICAVAETLHLWSETTL